MLGASKGSWGEDNGGITSHGLVLAAMLIGVLFGLLASLPDAASDHAAFAGQAWEGTEIGGLLK